MVLFNQFPILAGDSPATFTGEPSILPAIRLSVLL